MKTRTVGITISVGFDDLLGVTLPRNMPHFDGFLVVTTAADERTQAVARQHGADVLCTDAFYPAGHEGAFCKWAALERGLDCLRREGWICVLDADVVLPCAVNDCRLRALAPRLDRETLYGPFRRMLYDPTAFSDSLCWAALPRHRDVEFAGYCLLFNAAATSLGAPPWFGTAWLSAAGGDSEFERRWPASQKRRADWEVLHLGPDGQNWCGRVTDRLDGTSPAGADQNRARLAALRASRRDHGFSRERIDGKRRLG